MYITGSFKQDKTDEQLLMLGLGRILFWPDTGYPADL